MEETYLGVHFPQGFRSWVYYNLLGLPMIKIGTVELTTDEAYTAMVNKIYIITRRRVYKICQRKNSGQFYGKIVYTYKGPLGLVNRGRFCGWNKEDTEYLIKCPIENGYD